MVLEVDSGDFGHAVVVGVGGALFKKQGAGVARVGNGNAAEGGEAGSGGGAGSAVVVGILPAELEAGQKGVRNGAGIEVEHHIGLIEDVFAIGGLVVGQNLDGGAGVVHGAGINVLVEFIVRCVTGGVAEGDTA